MKKPSYEQLNTLKTFPVDSKERTEFLRKIGFVELTDGSIVERSNVVVRLHEEKENSNILKALDGTIYERKNGALVRRTFKKHEKRKLLRKKYNLD